MVSGNLSEFAEVLVRWVDHLGLMTVMAILIVIWYNNATLT